MRFILLLCAAGLAYGQTAPPKPLHADGMSSIDYATAADGSETVEIRNVTYDITGTEVPGRPAGERLLLRMTMRSKRALDDIGAEATVTLDAWRFGDDPRQKPLYSVTATGEDGHTVDDALFVIARGLEETEWWSVYKLGSGRHLFDTYVPLASFSIAREAVKSRYVGFEVPGDDATDARLKEPHVVGVLTYASAENVIREALVTSDNSKQAELLRSYADTTRTLAVSDHTIQLSFSQNFPSPPNAVTVRIPVRADDLDLVHAQLPPRVHASAWQRSP